MLCPHCNQEIAVHNRIKELEDDIKELEKISSLKEKAFKHSIRIIKAQEKMLKAADMEFGVGIEGALEEFGVSLE